MSERWYFFHQNGHYFRTNGETLWVKVKDIWFELFPIEE